MSVSWRRTGLTGLCIAALLLPAGNVAAQAEDAPPPNEPQRAEAAEAGMIELNLPEEIALEVLIDYVAKRQGVNFMYDRQVLTGSVTIKAPRRVPADALMTLMESALKMRGLALARTEVAGMMRIVRDNEQLAGRSEGLDFESETEPEQQAAGPTRAVTRVFRIEHASLDRVERVVNPFLSASSANMLGLADLGVVIVTDYAPNMARIERLIDLVDQPGRPIRTAFVELQHVEADAVVQKIEQVLEGMAEPGREAASALVLADTRTNRLAVVGTEAEIEKTRELISSFDVSLQLRTEIYELTVASPGQIDRLITDTLGEATADRLYRAAIDDQANLYVVTTTDEIHERIAAMKERIDRPIDATQNPIRFYKLENAKATDVLQTLRSIRGEQGLEAVSIDGIEAGGEVEPDDVEAEETEDAGDEEDDLVLRGPTAEELNRPRRSERRRGGGSVRVDDARVMADEPTNTIIVVAEPAIHQVYERLIERLDVRRPQVLVQATVVTIDTTDDFQLGVEIFSSGSADGGTLLNFTQFGLTTQESMPGSITLSPGSGFTGALLDADIAEVVIRALQADSRARVVARPSVLINDNATGVLTSEAEEPFASLNAANTVSTTSLGGYVAAGTTLEITPQISEGDHLNLEYIITLSSFGENLSETLPPSRLSNSLQSEATIPNDHTIVVGGLTRDNLDSSVQRVPLLGSIPGIEHLFSSRRNREAQTTLFLFIRAVILRDDEFADLKLLSGDALNQAGLEDGFPKSTAKTIR